MVLPKPKKDESEEDFVSRCIEKLTKEESDRFPSREQRAAVCYAQWRRDGREDVQAGSPKGEKRRSE